MQNEKTKDGETAAKRAKGGRPRLHPEGGRRPQLAFRVRGETYDLLKAAADAADRSISEEIESIVLRHFERVEQQVKDERDPAVNIGEMMKQALRLAALSAGANFYESDRGYDAAMAAIRSMMSIMKRPDGYDERHKEEGYSALALLGGCPENEEAKKLQLERARAEAIGWAATSYAYRLRKDPSARGDDYEMLLSGGMVGEPGYDVDALRKRILEDERGNRDKK